MEWLGGAPGRRRNGPVPRGSADQLGLRELQGYWQRAHVQELRQHLRVIHTLEAADDPDSASREWSDDSRRRYHVPGHDNRVEVAHVVGGGLVEFGSAIRAKDVIDAERVVRGVKALTGAIRTEVLVGDNQLGFV